MKKKSGVYAVFIVLAAVVSFITVAATIRSQSQKQSETAKSTPTPQQIEDNDPPILDYESEIQRSVTEETKKKNVYFNSRGAIATDKQIAELPAGVEPLPTNSHFWIGLSALPADRSDVIIVGDVTGAAAHLSENRIGIYSDFAIKVTEVLKDKGSIRLNDTVSANRPGASVRFASGRINKYTISRQGMPQIGERYVFFLSQIPETDDYLILTGYRLSGEGVTPLDGEDNKDPRSDLPFAQYRGTDEQTFLRDLRIALQANLAIGGKKP